MTDGQREFIARMECQLKQLNDGSYVLASRKESQTSIRRHPFRGRREFQDSIVFLAGWRELPDQLDDLG
jgi:hypothetical protein